MFLYADVSPSETVTSEGIAKFLLNNRIVSLQSVFLVIVSQCSLNLNYFHLLQRQMVARGEKDRQRGRFMLQMPAIARAELD